MQFIRFLARVVALVALVAASGCDSKPRIGTWEDLPGVSGPQIKTFDFDSAGNPIVGGLGGMWRYTDADGWVHVGALASDQQVYQFFPADDGGTYASVFHQLYKLGPGAAQWTLAREWTDGPGLLAVAYAGYVSGDGTMYDGPGGAGTGNSWPADGTAWVSGGVNPDLVDRDHNAYFFPIGDNITRKDAGTGAMHTVVDCHTKDLRQCTMRLFPMQFDSTGGLYLMTGSPLAIRLYRVPAAGGAAPTLVAAVPSGDAPNDYLYAGDASVTADGTAYLGAKRSTDDYSYGSMFRFTPGNSSGVMMFESPNDEMPSPDIAPMPQADLKASLDGTLYQYLPVNGGVARYVP